MADLRIVDAPLLPTVKGTEKIPTGGEGNFSLSVNQVADFAKLKWLLATEGYVDNAVGNVQDDLNLHKNNVSNPHQVTKEQVGLANVDNTADLDKPVSNATQSALTTLTQNKAEKTYVDTQLNTKADKATTYTKTETESLVSAKSDTTYVNTKYSSHIKTFLNTGTALSNTVNGEYFFVISNNSEKVEDLYLNVNGVATNQNKSELSSLLQHNSILGRDVTGAHQATSISTASGQNQQQINDSGGAKWYAKVGGYGLGATVNLDNGDTVKNTVPNNTANPNTNMTGWVIPYLGKSNNLDDVPSKTTARTNLDVYSKIEVNNAISSAILNGFPNATEIVAGKAKIATTAIAQAGVNDTDFITAKKLRDALNTQGGAPIYACRAWVNFNGTGTVAILGSGNVSSITDNGVGDYTVNYTVALPDTNYAIKSSSTELSDGTPVSVSLRMSGTAPLLKTSTATRISTRSAYNGAFLDVNNISLEVTC